MGNWTVGQAPRGSSDTSLLVLEVRAQVHSERLERVGDGAAGVEDEEVANSSEWP